MNTVVPISRDEHCLEAASRWVLGLDEGLGAADRDALEAWLAEDPNNVAAFLEVARVWDKTEDLKRLADLFPADLFSHEPAGGPARARRGIGAAGLALAATVVVAVGAGFLLLAGSPTDPQPPVDAPAAAHLQSRVLDYETAIGEQSSVLLPDGSVVVLNTNSHLQVAYSGPARVLLLKRGEIHVEVAEDRSRPLSVVAGNRIVQAVGTAFSVEITARQQLEVVVTDGRVLVQSEANTVNAGEELVLGAIDAAPVPVPMSADDIEVKLSWREGRLVFRSEPLEDALREVERYTTVQFVFLDEELKSRSMTGRYRAGDVESLLLALRANFNIAHEYASENRVLLSSL